MILEAREKDFQSASDVPRKMPVFSFVPHIFNHKELRSKYLKGMYEVDIPEHAHSSSEAILDEVRNLPNELELTYDQLFDLLLQFFHEKTYRILRENMLLLSRWGRFCKIYLIFQAEVLMILANSQLPFVASK